MLLSVHSTSPSTVIQAGYFPSQAGLLSCWKGRDKVLENWVKNPRRIACKGKVKRYMWFKWSLSSFRVFKFSHTPSSPFIFSVLASGRPEWLSLWETWCPMNLIFQPGKGLAEHYSMHSLYHDKKIHKSLPVCGWSTQPLASKKCLPADFAIKHLKMKFTHTRAAPQAWHNDMCLISQPYT